MGPTSVTGHPRTSLDCSTGRSWLDNLFVCRSGFLCSLIPLHDTLPLFYPSWLTPVTSFVHFTFYGDPRTILRSVFCNRLNWNIDHGQRLFIWPCDDDQDDGDNDLRFCDLRCNDRSQKVQMIMIMIMMIPLHFIYQLCADCKWYCATTATQQQQ